MSGVQTLPEIAAQYMAEMAPKMPGVPESTICAIAWTQVAIDLQGELDFLRGAIALGEAA